MICSGDCSVFPDDTRPSFKYTGLGLLKGEGGIHRWASVNEKGARACLKVVRAGPSDVRRKESIRTMTGIGTPFDFFGNLFCGFM